MSDIKQFSLRERIKSMRFALKGIKNLIVREHNARVHFVALFLVIAFGLFFQIDSTEWMFIAFVSGLVLVTELINTAIEKLADIVHPEWDDKIGLIKDYCAGAVLIAAIISIIVGGFIFTPKLLEVLN